MSILKYDIEKIATGFKFTEGPVWDDSSQSLLFSDIPANKIYRLRISTMKSEVFLEYSGFNGEDASLLSDMIGSNGLAWRAGELIICQHGNHAVASLEDGRIHNLAGEFQGKPLNSPNDLSIDQYGNIYFTDPPYGLKDQILNPRNFQSHGGVYRLRNSELELIYAGFEYPNGICFSPTGEYMYLGSNKENERNILRFEVTENKQPSGPTEFLRENADGLKTDEEGNLYLATNEGVKIFSPGAEFLGTFPLPEVPSNLAIVQDHLYVTARTSIYRLRKWD